ncbi:MAG: hypothetical protein JW881_17825 [Spirochaetales bacterium]|nr:hypothetical protein [Spirochaetales bacterium]
MKKRILLPEIIVLLLLTIFASSCASTGGTSSEAGVDAARAAETPIEKNRGEEVFLNGKIIRIADIEQSKYSDTMKTGVLAEETSVDIGGIIIPLKEGEAVRFNTEYNYIIEATLADNITVNTEKSAVMLKAGTPISFMRNYTGDIYLYGGYLFDDSELTIGSYRIDAAAAGNQYLPDIVFNFKGEIVQLTLQSDHTFIIKDTRYTFSKGTRLSFINGKVSGGILKENKKVNIGKYEVTALASSGSVPSINFTEDGNIFMIMIAEPVTLRVGTQRIPVMAKKYLSFHYNTDAPHFVYLGSDAALIVAGEKKALKAGAKLEFDREGRITKVE